MTDQFKQMDCYVLAGGKRNVSEDFAPDGEITRLEKGYRRYAALFEKVSLVVKKEQAREKYLNYPHVCDPDSDHGIALGVATALEDADSEAVFIGSSEISDFPLRLIVELVRNYSGEPFLGYYDSRSTDGSHQPLFGIYNKGVLTKLQAVVADQSESLEKLLSEEGRLIPLPDDIPADRIGLG